MKASSRLKPLSKMSSRLKRANVFRFTSVLFSEANVALSSSDPVACIYSTFIIIFARVVSTGLSPRVVKRAPPTLSQVLNTLNIAHPVTVDKDGITDIEYDRPSGDGEILCSPVFGDIELMETSSCCSVERQEALGMLPGANASGTADAASVGDGQTTVATVDDSPQGGDSASPLSVGKSPPPTPNRMPSQGAAQGRTRAESNAGVGGRSSFSMPAVSPFSQFGDSRDSMTGKLPAGQCAGFLDIVNDVREEYLTIARAAIEVSISCGDMTC